MSTLDKIVASLAEDLKPAVDLIEAESCPATRNNYGKYMAIFGQFAADANQGRIMAMALKKAGANAQGVDDALKVSF